MAINPFGENQVITKFGDEFVTTKWGKTYLGDKSGDQFAKYGEKFGESSNGVTTLSLDLVTN